MNYILLTRMYSSNSLPTIQKSAKIIRNEFLDYFKKDLGHTFIRSSPVTSFNDNTVAFVNAGMNQFKGVFLNYYNPPATKVTNSQKCIRISGKHNDLNIIGNDTYHHTFFEMLGSWSFGSYFKKEACHYAWNLLTKHYGINEEFLYVTYFGGDKKLQLEPDLECKDIWLSIGVKKDKVIPFGIEENFWEMGISGPCGPCTEIHIDHKKQLKNQCIQINKDYKDLTELWNIVFIQYERLPNGTIVPLSNHYIDTGMGLERLVAVLQGKQSNYDTDLFQPLMNAIHKYTNAPKYKSNDENDLDNGYRIIADHIRMITVALADGVVPEQSNKLRKIIRKSIDISENIFKKRQLLSELSYDVVENLGDVYPELQTNFEKVQTILKFEEELYEMLRISTMKKWIKVAETYPQLKSVTEKFLPGLGAGYKYLQKIIDLKKTNVLPGDVAFTLYDRYGLNVETIIELSKIESLKFDEMAFQKELEDLRHRSRIGLESADITVLKKSLKVLEENGISKTDDSFKYKYVFNGNNYKFPKIESKILALVINDNVVLNKTNDSTNEDMHSTINTIIKNSVPNTNINIGFILDKTLCYSPEHGQISDLGIICMKDLNFNVTTLKKINGYVIHYGSILPTDLMKWTEKLKMENNCFVSINSDIRERVMRNHTATHLLNKLMQQTMQAAYLRSSIDNSDNLQCTFNTFGQKLSYQSVKMIEDCITDVIKADIPITTKILNTSELLAENSITLLPGTIYPYTDIRVMEINSRHFQLKVACCGTHIIKTGELNNFCIYDQCLNGISNLTIKALIGSRAASAKLAGVQTKLLIQDLENKCKSEDDIFKISKCIKDLKVKINQNDGPPIPYTIKEECLSKLTYLTTLNNKKQKSMKTHLVQNKMDQNN